MMIEYLEKLAEERKYAEAIALAERLIREDDNTELDLLAIYSTQLRALVHTDHFEEAVSVGLAATALARQTQSWDWFGVASANLGLAFSKLGNREMALQWWFAFLAQVPEYRTALRHEAHVWYNLGSMYMDADHEQAASFMRRALDSAKRHGDERYAHGLRQALIQLHLKSGMWEQIPSLLAKSAAFLRHNSQADFHRSSRLYHLQLRAEFACHTNRRLRAILVAVRGIWESDGHPIHKHLFHMVLARCFWDYEPGPSVAHALSARAYATVGHLPALSVEAGAFVYDLLRAGSSIRRDFEQYNRDLISCAKR